MGGGQPTPGNITAQEFKEALGRYGSLIQAVSDTKGAKHGQKTLAELDEFRYVTAPEIFGPSVGKSKRPMGLEDIKVLVDWKLRHGKFRPTLMKLVSSNDPSTAESTVRDAIAQYESSKDASKAVDALSKLRGIGPATASLLLAVHDMERVVFFADEAFYWLCSGGRRDVVIKYNAKEYAQLHAAAREVCDRLGEDGDGNGVKVKAADVERVAYVLMKHEEAAPFAADGGGGGSSSSCSAVKGESEMKGKKNGGRVIERPTLLRMKSSDERKRKQRAGSGSVAVDEVTATATTPTTTAAASGPTALVTSALEDEGGLRRSKRGKRV